jgi:hypothetical protein
MRPLLVDSGMVQRRQTRECSAAVLAPKPTSLAAGSQFRCLGESSDGAKL